MKRILTSLCYILLAITLSTCAFTDRVIHGGKITDFVSVDTSGILNEQSVKGWLYNSKSRRIVIVSAHTGPVVGSPVTIIDNKGIRHNFKLVDVRYPIFQVIKDRKPTPMSQDDLFAGDITLGVLDRPADSDLKAYNLATAVKDSELVATMHQDLLFSYGRLVTRESSAILSRRDVDKLAIPGDSGLPWFNTNGEIVSHNTLGNAGHGPAYTHLFINTQLKNELAKLENLLSQ